MTDLAARLRSGKASPADIADAADAVEERSEYERQADVYYNEAAQLAERLAAAEAERDALKAKYDEEHATVSRVWKALGISTYEGAGGKEISEIVSDRCAALAEALEVVGPFAKEADRYDPEEDDDTTYAWDSGFLIGQLRRARSFIAKHGGKN